VRYFLAFLALGGASAALASAPVTYRHYTDAVLVDDVPNDAKQVDPGEFRTVYDGKLTTFELISSTLHSFDDEPDCDGRPPTYKVRKLTLSAYSCQKGQSVLYHVEKYGRTYKMGASDGTDTIELTINYPAAQRAYWDPIVAHMSQSLQFASQAKVKTHG